jgi:iron complex transport system substrate-binding protein
VGPTVLLLLAAATATPRVISLHDVTTEMVVALGAVDRLVGVAPPVDQPAATRAAVAHLPRAEGAESLVALAPTLVLGMHTVGERSPELVAMLRARGTEVLLGDPRTLGEVLGLLATVAGKLGVSGNGDRLAGPLRAQLSASTGGKRVFVYDCCDPAFTAGGRAVLNDVIARAGGRNVFADLDQRWSKVPWEAVIARKPELIVIDDYDFAGQSDVAGKRAQLARIPSLAGVPTVVMPLGEALGGLRSFAGLARLRRALAAP